MISSKDVFSAISEYLKSKSTVGVIFNAEHSSSNVSAETKLLLSYIWLKLLAERLIFSAKASCVSERLILISRILFPKFFFIDIVSP